MRVIVGGIKVESDFDCFIFINARAPLIDESLIFIYIFGGGAQTHHNFRDHETIV